ncbi:hypothetical protein FF38_01688 [Lucilia cuprina]|uniref:MD-2-related lipid-recognition domain-containing protein n=1 Tax=Lucilia cuprina TaxID=7375 RepID=A0A0L0CCC7_LUCCU|nr:hypothetical protein FF38_01688 [Lucilia cuprina]
MKTKTSLSIKHLTHSSQHVFKLVPSFIYFTAPASFKRMALNGSIMYKKDLNQFDVTFILTAPKLNGQPWTVLNVTVNGCEYLVKSRGNNIKKFPYFFLSELRVSNPDFPKNCPIEKGKEIPVRNFYIRSEKISMNFPQVPFSCICILRRHRVQAFKLFFNGSFGEQK